MILCIIASDVKRIPPYYFKAGLKMTTDVYVQVMSKVVKPWIDANGRI